MVLHMVVSHADGVLHMIIFHRWFYTWLYFTDSFTHGCVSCWFYRWLYFMLMVLQRWLYRWLYFTQMLHVVVFDTDGFTDGGIAYIQEASDPYL